MYLARLRRNEITTREAGPVLTVLGLAIAVWLVAMVVLVVPVGQDAHAYWAASLDAPYRSSTAGEFDAYLYSPAFLQAIAPLKLLPWTAFHAVIVATIALLVVVVWRAWSPIVLLLPVVVMELGYSNIDIALGIASGAALRWPVLWAFPLLTKVGPGIGVLWHAARGEWRSLGWALGSVGVIIAASALIGGDWVGWGEVLTRNGTAVPPGWVVPVPLPVRAVAAALLVVWGARTDRPWTVVVAGMLALPSLGLSSMSFLVGLGVSRAASPRAPR